MSNDRVQRMLRESVWQGFAPIAAVLVALVLMGGFLLAAGRNPFQTYMGIISGAFGSRFGIFETLVAATPIMLCALAVSLAAWVGLLSLGAEGQLYLGAIGATAVVLAIPQAPAWQLLPCMGLAAALAGGLWSVIPGALRARYEVNETIVSLLMNYIAVLLVEYLVHGPWQDSASYSWPQSPAFPVTAELPHWSASRLHLGFCFGPGLAVIFWLIRTRTRPGFVMRVLSSNQRAAQYAHYPVARYLIVTMLVSGAVAGLAGFGQVSGIEGRLRAAISPGYGYTGFLVAWLARHNPLAIVVVAILLGALLSGADSLQLREKLPFAAVNILQGCIFFCLLCADYFVDRSSTSAKLRGAE